MKNPEVEFMNSLYNRARDKKLNEARSMIFSLFFFRRFGLLYNESYQDEWIDRFLRQTEFVYGDSKSQELITKIVDEVQFILGVTR